MPADIHELFQKVREHPDYVFGTIFVRADFPNGEVPAEFPATYAADILAERANLYIDDHWSASDAEA